MPHVYDRLARYYDRAFAPFERWFLRGWRKEALAELPENSRILELGCGTGANFELYPPATLAVSSEISVKMIEKATKTSGNNHILQADAQCLPFPDDSFDAAFATLVFCSVPDPVKALLETRRILRQEGRLVLLEHVRPPGWKGKLFDFLNMATVALIDDHFNRETAELARGAGYELTDVRIKAGGAVNLIVCKNP